jgi:squalene-hopene/tetraprenyl-beta-curcumene cyclase
MIAMKTTLALLLATGLAAHAAQPANPYLSLEQEMLQAIARGNAWLKEQQKPEGFWDTADLPAFTALALTAAVRDPALDPQAPLPEHLRKGFDWLVAQQKEDGGIYNRGLSVYNTATALTALTSLSGPNLKPYEAAAVKARRHLISKQWDVESSDPNHGGIGYGSNEKESDLSNTHLAIEALALSQRLVEDGNYGDEPDLDWAAAIKFISRCQNHRATNDQEQFGNDGGFAYSPHQSKAGTEETDGRTTLRSYGSMSYAGLLSLIYAKLSPDDPRVKAVLDWASKNYTVKENPGMGAEGLYYYYQAMSKALTAANVDRLKLADGKQADWRDDLGRALLTRQRENGSWVNDNGRWMESNPALVTAYSVLALQQLCASIPKKAE